MVGKVAKNATKNTVHCWFNLQGDYKLSAPFSCSLKCGSPRHTIFRMAKIRHTFGFAACDVAKIKHTICKVARVKHTFRLQLALWLKLSTQCKPGQEAELT